MAKEMPMIVFYTRAQAANLTAEQDEKERGGMHLGDLCVGDVQEGKERWVRRVDDEL